MKMTRTLGMGMLIVMLCATLKSVANPPVTATKYASQTFTRNVGQVTDQYLKRRNDIDFKLSAGGGMNIFIGAGRLHYQFSHNVTGSNETTPNREDDYTDNIIAMYRMDVELLGSNANAKVIAEDRAVNFERYYTNGLNGAMASKYSKITYVDVYPHIDWIFYFNTKGQLEHDFIVHEGGKVSDIKMRYSGATQLSINADGSLTAHTPFGMVKENTPYAYQRQDKKVIASSFILKENVLSFSTADYKGTLVIDPVLEWGTYFGDLLSDRGQAITVGKYNEVYVCGITNSVANIATTGAHQDTFAGGTNTAGADAFLAKFDRAGNLMWATYYGGGDVDLVKAIDCDTAGNIYMAGYTRSTGGIATSGSHKDTWTGVNSSYYDAFLVRFDTSGQRIWGTYFGGTGQEGTSFLGLHCDKHDNVYITGNTGSTSDIATTGAFQASSIGNDAFLAQFNVLGVLQWATYIGGSGADFGCGITSDVASNIYVAGYTNSTDQIATTGTHQSAIGGNNDAFVMKFDMAGQRIWGTYFGGTGLDNGYALACDDSCNIYLGGVTASTSDIATTGSFQPTIGGSQDGYLARFDSSGVLDWGTYFGGSGSDLIVNGGLAYVSVNESIYITGHTNSSSGIASANALLPNHFGSYDAFIAKYEITGEQNWSTYFGGSSAENTGGIAVDISANVYVTGFTNSATGIATTGGYQLTLGGNYDAFIVRINDCEAPDAPLAITGDTEICSNDTILYSIAAVAGVDGYSWILPGGWLGNSDSTSILTTPDNNQSGIIQVAAVNYCTTSDTISLTVTVKPAPEPVIQRNNNILSTTQPYSSYEWSRNGEPIAGASNSTYVITENGDYTVTVTAANDCGATSDVHVIDHLSNERFAGLQFEVYPNPALDMLYIETKTSGTMQLHDVTGRVLVSGHLNAGANVVDISKLQNGMYLIKVHGTDGSYIGTVKLIKTNE